VSAVSGTTAHGHPPLRPGRSTSSTRERALSLSGVSGAGGSSSANGAGRARGSIRGNRSTSTVQEA
jgi:hypothetical protein